MLAIIDAYRAGLLKPNHWISNIISGSIVGVVALPLAMAFAIASGVKPEQGLYTAIISALIVGVFGGSRVQIAGPTGAFIVVLAGITAQYGVTGLQAATFLAGFILLVMGFLKLGTIIKFIPGPVITGFTSGIGVIIFVGEWKDFFGLPTHVPLDAHFYTKFLLLIKSLPQFNPETAGLALFSLLLVMLTPKIFKRIPGPLIALLMATGLQMIFQFKHVATIGSAFGSIPQLFPQLHLPVFSFTGFEQLVGPAITIALLGAIESLLSATAADNMAGTRHHSNQELIGQGLANIIAPLFGGFAATGAIARTATNVRNGGNSPISAIVHSVFLLLVIVLLAPFASAVPLCTLAAILFVVSYNMSDVPHFIHIVKHAPRDDVLVLVTTFLLTIFSDLVIAVSVGVLLATLCFVKRMHQSVAAEKLDHAQFTGLHDMQLPQDTLVYAIQGPFFFAAAEKLEKTFAEHHHSKNIIFSLKNVPFMDMTGLQTFTEMVSNFQKRNMNIYVCEANDAIIHKFTKTGVMRFIKNEQVFNTLQEAVREVM